MTASSPRPLRIGILGAANIARLFVAGVCPSLKVAVTAVASRDVERGRKFASETGITQVQPTYEALLADPEIDAIYNPLPNNLHAEWSIRAANAGKHVLCEKPLATSATEARAMFAAAARNGVQLAEAYPYRAQPQTLKLRELLKEKAIGRLQLIQASFGFPMTDAANIRLNPAPAQSGAGRRRADGRRLLSGQPGPHYRRGTAQARPRDGRLERERRRSDACRIAGILKWAAGAGFVQLRDRASPARVCRRRQRGDPNDVFQRHVRCIPALARNTARARLGCKGGIGRDRGDQRLSRRSRSFP
jgi:hypothetical protein